MTLTSTDIIVWIVGFITGASFTIVTMYIISLLYGWLGGSGDDENGDTNRPH